MNKKKFSRRTLIFLTLVLIVFYGMHYESSNKLLTTFGRCDFTSTPCELMLKNEAIGISFIQAPITEEELFINFSLPDIFTLNRVWIEGVDMYMGKTPVMFENEAQPSVGVTFLGACNLAEMKWVMFVEVVEPGNQNAEHIIVSASFSTYLE